VSFIRFKYAHYYNLFRGWKQWTIQCNSIWETRSSRNALWNSLALGVVIKVVNPEMYLKDKTINIIGRGTAGSY